MRYLAEDGTVFTEAQECIDYENNIENAKKQKSIDAENLEKLKSEYAKALHDYYEKYPEDRVQDEYDERFDNLLRRFLTVF